MDWPYVHLVLNHVPLILLVAGTTSVLIGAITSRRAFWVWGIPALAIAGLLTYPTLLTGDRAEQVMEKQWYVVRDALEAHEEAAKRALWPMLVLAAVSLTAWWRMVRRPQEPLNAWIRASALVVALVGSGLVVWAAKLGGDVVHKSPRLEQRGPSPGPLVGDSVATPTTP